MSENKQKTWKNSANKWAYLKIAIIYFTTPAKVYEIAHKSRGTIMRERILRRDSSNQKSDIDLENGHI